MTSPLSYMLQGLYGLTKLNPNQFSINGYRYQLYKSLAMNLDVVNALGIPRSFPYHPDDNGVATSMGTTNNKYGDLALCGFYFFRWTQRQREDYVSLNYN